MYINVQFLNQCNTTTLKIRTKIIIVGSEIKHKSVTMLRVIRDLVLDFIRYFVAAYMRNYPIHVTSAQNITQNTLCII